MPSCLQVLRKRLVPSPIAIEHAEEEDDGGGDIEGAPCFSDADVILPILLTAGVCPFVRLHR